MSCFFLVQGTNGSQLWDTCFAVQAFLEVKKCRIRIFISQIATPFGVNLALNTSNCFF